MTTKTLNLKNTDKLPITDDIKKITDAAFAKRNRLERYRGVAKSIAPWLRRLTEAYKTRGQFPITPAILGDFYKDHDDKVIATLIGSLCLSAYNTDTMMDEANNLRMIMGEHPYGEFFMQRRYTLLSLGESQEKQIGGFGSLLYWQISKIIDSLWNTNNEYDGRNLEGIFRYRVINNHMTPYNALCTMVNMGLVRASEYRINVALLALCGKDGISYHLWDNSGIEDKLQPPIDINMSRFLNIICPYYKKYGFSINEVAGMFGMEPSDLWYCNHAYREFVKLNMSACSSYIRRYHSQLKNGRSDWNNRRQLKEIEPEIKFI